MNETGDERSVEELRQSYFEYLDDAYMKYAIDLRHYSAKGLRAFAREIMALADKLDPPAQDGSTLGPGEAFVQISPPLSLNREDCKTILADLGGEAKE